MNESSIHFITKSLSLSLSHSLSLVYEFALICCRSLKLKLARLAFDIDCRVVFFMHSLPTRLLCVKNLFTQAVVYLSVYPSVCLFVKNRFSSLSFRLSLFPFCLFVLSQCPLPSPSFSSRPACPPRQTSVFVTVAWTPSGDSSIELCSNVLLPL